MAAAERAGKGAGGAQNPMRSLVIDRLVINIGTGSEESVNANARKLLELITKRKPAISTSKQRNPAFKISKGQHIGAFVTIRGPDVKPLAEKLFEAVEKKVKASSITNNSVSFGIKEYIDISGVKYDPKIGMLGMNVNLSIRRKGGRIQTRKRRTSRVPLRHRVVSPTEIRDFIKREFGVEVAE